MPNCNPIQRLAPSSFLPSFQIPARISSRLSLILGIIGKEGEIWLQFKIGGGGSTLTSAFFGGILSNLMLICKEA